MSRLNPTVINASQRAVIQAALEERGWSQSRLARELDMNETLLSHHIAGRRRSSWRLLDRIGHALELNLRAIAESEAAA